MMKREEEEKKKKRKGKEKKRKRKGEEKKRKGKEKKRQGEEKEEEKKKDERGKRDLLMANGDTSVVIHAGRQLVCEDENYQWWRGPHWKRRWMPLWQIPHYTEICDLFLRKHQQNCAYVSGEPRFPPSHSH